MNSILLSVIAIVIICIINPLVMIPNGHIGVPVFGGKWCDYHFSSGFSISKPWYRVEIIKIIPDKDKIDTPIPVLTADNIKMEFKKDSISIMNEFESPSKAIEICKKFSVKYEELTLFGPFKSILQEFVSKKDFSYMLYNFSNLNEELHILLQNEVDQITGGGIKIMTLTFDERPEIKNINLLEHYDKMREVQNEQELTEAQYQSNMLKQNRTAEVAKNKQEAELKLKHEEAIAETNRKLLSAKSDADTTVLLAEADKKAKELEAEGLQALYNNPDYKEHSVAIKVAEGMKSGDKFFMSGETLGSGMRLALGNYHINTKYDNDDKLQL